MFKIDSDPHFTATVVVGSPDGAGARQDFKATFRVLPVTTFSGFDLSTPEGTKDFLEAAIVDLDDVVDAKGRKLPYGDELRTALLDMVLVRGALVKTYVEAVGRAAAGN